MSNQTSQKSQGVVLQAKERELLVDQARKHGENTVRAALCVSRGAFERALAGLPVRLGTIALIKSGMAKL